MRSIKEIYIIGRGPSSSHTMGPSFASEYIINKYPNMKHCDITLFGSLAFTGKGHLTDAVISDIFKKAHISHSIIFNYKKRTKHPNTMLFLVTKEDNKKVKEIILSIGGGSILPRGNKEMKGNNIYPHQFMDDIVSYCRENKYSLFDYIIHFEGENIIDYCSNVLKSMDDAAQRGIKATGYLPGKLHLKRKANAMFNNMSSSPLGENDVAMNVSIVSMAVAEENASGGIVSTAPTCGSAGVIPGIIKYLRMKNVSDNDIIKGLCVAGLFGMICKTNASVSGAQGGCQAEIGVACSMGAAMIAYCFKKPTETIVQAAEIALEHSLGLTCDPVDGYVQVPCIERCAIFAIKAINAVKLASIIPNSYSVVSYDTSVKTMYITGKDMNVKYRETSSGGLAKIVKKSKKEVY